MANKHYTVEEEVEIHLTVKVKLKSISNYERLNASRITEEIEAAKSELPNFLLKKLQGSHQQQELTNFVDYWDFDVIVDS